ncbi:hypothetical protein LOTGIDRAFT_173537 [Lottia gigantea]|uniref:Uncharacterized protein n=1 Tax=Lottia gigantea TaxID=225164 RepID=V4AXH1_LOTGI|nr:hypothetical protein LOTGIDRAFT_173537 [Lottia gigantea]ESO99745.1 hypothetical protein LOTGIDRAFT_173537 [Lottia gigantea]
MEKYHRLYLDAEERLDRLIERCRNDRQVDLKGYEEIELYRRYPSSTEGDDGCDKVWTSDDESNPSSGSESRESSAGSNRSRTKPISKHPPFNKDPRHRTRNRPDLLSPLQLNIPAYAKSSRDSGLSSGDPSPNMNTSTTSSPNTPTQPGYTEDVLASPDVASLVASRPHLLRSQSTTDTNNQLSRIQDRSRAATLSISNSRLREITDPIVQMLVQLHKIIYITQLPPTLSPNFERRKIDEYKRALFSRHSHAVSLKTELKKLMQGCHDVVDILTNPADILRRPLSSGLDRDPSGLCCSDREIKEMGITYEQLHNLIEKTLNSTGYYSVAYRQREKTPPFSPIAKHTSRLS